MVLIKSTAQIGRDTFFPTDFFHKRDNKSVTGRSSASGWEVPSSNEVPRKFPGREGENTAKSF